MSDWGKVKVWQSGEYEGLTRLDADDVRRALVEMVQNWREIPCTESASKAFEQCADEIKDVLDRWEED
jgi:hypothetical protein